MFDFVSIGEILVDLSPCSPDGGPVLYRPNPGGAPANTAAAAAKLGLQTAFIGKAGNDLFGRSCKEALKSAGVCTEYLALTSDYPTTLALVALGPDGDREFSFYRSRFTADVNLSKDDLTESVCKNTRIFHFGSVALTEEPEKSAVLYGVEEAKKAGALISCDPNLRLSLWRSQEEAKGTILKAIGFADILKLSAEEAEFLFGKSEDLKICKEISEGYGVKLVLLTKGAEGCCAYLNGRGCRSCAYDLKIADTTGAGDAFLAGVVYRLLQSGRDLEDLSDEEVNEMLDFANALGALVASKAGAIPAIPSLEEIYRCMETGRRLIF